MPNESKQSPGADKAPPEAVQHFVDQMSEQGTVPADSADEPPSDLQTPLGTAQLHLAGEDEATRQETARASLATKMELVHFGRAQAEQVLSRPLPLLIAGTEELQDLQRRIRSSTDELGQLPEWSVQFAVSAILRAMLLNEPQPAPEQVSRLQFADVFVRSILEMARYSVEHLPPADTPAAS